jgi:glycosyltransferase involved in cell wall biosynthesis
MSKSPYVSVVVPAYKTRHTIAETLDSILAQTFKDYEIIVVEDGSPDDVAEFVERTYGNKVTLIRQENRGLAGARNTGLGVARGTYVAFLDSDDAWLPEKLERQVKLIQQHPEADVFYSNCYFWQDGEKAGEWRDIHSQSSGYIIERLINRDVMLPVLTALIKKASIDAVGGFDTSLRQVEDYDLWLRMGLGGACFVADPHPTALYRINPEGLSQNRLLMAETQLVVYRKQQTEDPTLQKALGRQIKIFRTEVLHQKRLLAAQNDDNLQASLLTLQMAAVRPHRAVILLAAAVLFLIVPRYMRKRLTISVNKAKAI